MFAPLGKTIFPFCCSSWRTICCLVVFSLLLFLTFSALVANPKKLLYTVANHARGLLDREKNTK